MTDEPRCCVCGEHADSPSEQRYQLMVAFGWSDETKPNSSVSVRSTRPLYFHAGACWSVLDWVEHQGGLHWLTFNWKDRAKSGRESMVEFFSRERRGWPVMDVDWTIEILKQIESPFIP